MVLYILIFKFLERRWEDKRLWTKWKQAFPEFNLVSFVVYVILICYCCSQVTITKIKLKLE